MPRPLLLRQALVYLSPTVGHYRYVSVVGEYAPSVYGSSLEAMVKRTTQPLQGGGTQPLGAGDDGQVLAPTLSLHVVV